MLWLTFGETNICVSWLSLFTCYKSASYVCVINVGCFDLLLANILLWREVACEIFCLLDCFSRCRLITDNTVSNGLDDSILSDDTTCSACDPAQSVLRSFHSIVAYGLGHFSTCPIASFQFALLLLLAEVLKVNFSYT